MKNKKLTELKKLENKFQKFLEEEYPASHELDQKFIKEIKNAFIKGALAGTDLFVEYYENNS